MDLNALSVRCREETEKFRRRLPSDPAFCLELWRRALHGATAAERETAWRLVDEGYRRQIVEWFRLHPLAQAAGRYGAEDDFAQAVFERLLIANERAPLRADSLPELLAFARTCLNNLILMAVRRREAPQAQLEAADATAGAADPAAGSVAREEASEVWRRLCACATHVMRHMQQVQQNTRSAAWAIRLLTLRWIQQYRPNEIVAEFPGEYPDVHEIFRVLARVKACYKRQHGLEP